MNFRLHPIHRDSSEKYLVLYGRGDIEVYDTTGTAATVNISAKAADYLASGGPSANNLRMISVADYTIIVNTLVNANTIETITTFSITATFDTYTKMTSRVGVPDAYYHTTLANTPYPHPPGYWQYVLSAANNGFATWSRDTQLGSNWLQVTRNWDNSSYNPMGFRVRTKRKAFVDTELAYTIADHKLAKTGAFSDYDHVAGDEIHITDAGSTSLPEGWYLITANSGDNDITLDYNDSTGINYRDDEDGVQVYLDATGDKNDCDSDMITVSASVTANFDGTDSGSTPAGDAAEDMDDVAERLMVNLQTNVGMGDALIYWDKDNRTMVFTTHHRGSEVTVVNFYSPDSGFDLTTASRAFKFSQGTVVAGTGSPDDDEDEKPVEDRWNQVPGPGETDSQLDNKTLPVQLTRTTVSPLVFAIDEIDWEPRLSGDHDSNPAPSLFVDKDGSPAAITIADVGFHRNRLLLAGDENLVFSQDGDFFNFFLNNSTNIVDSDPIDRSLSSDRVTLVDFVISFRKSLIIFTKSDRQFELNAPEAFTPNTVAVTPSTSYVNVPNVRPQLMHDSLFFVSPDGLRSTLHDYHFSDNSVSNVADAVSAHVHQLLPAEIKTIQTVPTEGTVFLLPTEDNVIYYYQHFKDPRRKQAAWSKWIFDPNYEIDDIAVIGNELYMLVLDKNETERIFEKIDVSKSSINPDPESLVDANPTCA